MFTFFHVYYICEHDVYMFRGLVTLAWQPFSLGPLSFGPRGRRWVEPGVQKRQELTKDVCRKCLVVAVDKSTTTVG